MTIRKRWTDAPVSSLGMTGRRTHLHPHRPEHRRLGQNDKCARRRRRENLSGAPVHTRVWALSWGRACGAPWFLRFSRKLLGRGTQADGRRLFGRRIMVALLILLPWSSVPRPVLDSAASRSGPCDLLGVNRSADMKRTPHAVAQVKFCVFQREPNALTSSCPRVALRVGCWSAVAIPHDGGLGSGLARQRARRPNGPASVWRDGLHASNG